MHFEYNNTTNNITWELVDQPPKKKLVGTKWVWKAKYTDDDTLEKYKARLGTQGFFKVKYFDVNETFAPTTWMTTMHMVLALAATRKWPVY